MKWFFYSKRNVFQKLKTLIESNGSKHLFAEETRIGYLTHKCRKTVVHFIVGVIESKFTLAATEAEIAEVCKAAIDLFPSLRHSPSKCGGIVSFIDPKVELNYISYLSNYVIQDLLFNYEGSCGWVYEALKYRKRMVFNHIQELANTDTANLSVPDDDTDQNDTAFKEMEKCLGGFVLPKDLSKLKEYLENTVGLRRRVLRGNGNGFPNIFLFYLTNPELVSPTFRLIMFMNLFA